MNPNDTFIDPMDELMARFEGGNVPVPTPPVEEVPEPTTVSSDEVLSIKRPVDTIDEDDIDYGDDDMAAEIAAEEQREQEQQKLAREQQEAAKKQEKVKMPPRSLDPQYQNDAIAFETNKIAIVTTMINHVIAKHHIISGGIPEEKRMNIMGDLVELYYKNGEVITPEFEQLILSNWEGGTTVEQKATEDAKAEQQQSSEDVQEEAQPTQEIHINVEPNTPVTVNIDGEMLNDVQRDQKIQIHVHEVSDLDMRTATIIENSQMEGIIVPYDTSATDTPITLPMSAYRATVSGCSLFDVIKLSSLQSGNPRDLDIRTWELLYHHTKHPSIGEFKSFEDFMKHTDYRDMELLLWAMFVATADEVETIHFRCGNPKCRHEMELKYSPRSIIHVSDNLIPEHYKKTHSVPAGKGAVDHWNSVHNKKRMYELPDSKVMIELDDYSAWDYHNIKMPLMQEVYMRYRPDDPNMQEQLSREEQEEMNFTLLFLLYIKSIIINKDGKSYRYTNWADIEKIVSSHISNRDISVLIAIIQKVRAQESPVSFYLENVECPKCGRKDDRIPVNDIMRSLFFQLSSGLTNTSIDFVETDKI